MRPKPPPDSPYYDQRDRWRTVRDRLEHVDLVLRGTRGVGKTRLLEEVERRTSGAVYVFLQDGRTLDDLRRRIAERLGHRPGWWQGVRTGFFGADPPPPLEALDDLFAERPPRDGLLLLLDEAQDWIDALPAEDRQAVVPWLLSLRSRFGVAVALAGSVSVRGCLRGHGVTLGAAWEDYVLRPMEPADGRSWFFDQVRCTVDDAGERLAYELGGGLPRWIQRIALQVVAEDAGESDVRGAADRVVEAEAFQEELGHVRRRLGEVAVRTLRACARAGATRNTVFAEVAAPRAEVEAALAGLEESDLLAATDPPRFVLPLLAVSLRRGRR